jgi:hypothetical protein
MCEKTQKIHDRTARETQRENFEFIGHFGFMAQR